MTQPLKIAIAGLGEYTASVGRVGRASARHGRLKSALQGHSGPPKLSLRATTRNPSRQASQHRFGQEYMPNMAPATAQYAQEAT